MQSLGQFILLEGQGTIHLSNNDGILMLFCSNTFQPAQHTAHSYSTLKRKYPLDLLKDSFVQQL